MKLRLLRWLCWCLSIALLGSLFFIVPLKDVCHSLLLTNPLIFIIAMIFVVMHLYLRSIRWALLFSPHYHVTGKTAAGPVMISLATNGVLPWKIGELVRVAIGAKKFKSGFPFTIATVIGDRLLDSLSLLLFLNVAIILLPDFDYQVSVKAFNREIGAKIIPHLIKTIYVTSGIILFSIILLILPKTRTLLSIIISLLPALGLRINKFIDKALPEAVRGLTAFQNFRILLKVTILSLATWLLLAFTTQLISLSMPGIKLNFIQSFTVTVISISAASIPSTPGAWGIFEGGALLALKLLNVPCAISESIAFVLVLHLSLYIPVILMGAVMVMKGELTTSELYSVIHSSVQQQSSKDKHISGNEGVTASENGKV